MDNIYLCGFMGCGKTTVGLELAKLTGYRFYDLDKYITENSGLPVIEIFKKYGESRFRELEASAAADLASGSRLVIATGGGAVINPDNKSLFKSTGVIVFIDVPLDIIFLRLKGDVSRPLFSGGTEKISALYKNRLPLYKEAADFTVRNPDNREGRLIAADILKHYNKFLGHNGT